MKEDPYAEFNSDENDNLKNVLRQLADELVEANAEVDRIKEQLLVAENVVKNLTDNRIPAVAEGLEGKFDLGDGRTLTIKEEIRASVAGEKLAPAVEWLDAHDYGNLVKRNLIFEFGKDDDERVKKFKEAVEPILKQQRLVLKEKHAIHNATLVAWVKERLEEGDNLPVDVFGIFRQRVAKVKE
jgi:site-specific DNA-cytosine methylase